MRVCIQSLFLFARRRRLRTHCKDHLCGASVHLVQSLTCRPNSACKNPLASGAGNGNTDGSRAQGSLHRRETSVHWVCTVRSTDTGDGRDDGVGGRGIREELLQLQRAQVSLGSDMWVLSSRMGGGSMQQRCQERARVLDTFSGPLPDPPHLCRLLG